MNLPLLCSIAFFLSANSPPFGRIDLPGAVDFFCLLCAANAQSPAREHFTVTVLGPQPPVSEWRVMRLVSTGTQQDGVRRLCLRALRLFGIVRVDLMKQVGPGGLAGRAVWACRAGAAPDLWFSGSTRHNRAGDSALGLALLAPAAEEEAGLWILRADFVQAEGLVMNRKLLERVLAAVGSDHLGNPPA